MREKSGTSMTKSWRFDLLASSLLDFHPAADLDHHYLSWQQARWKPVIPARNLKMALPRLGLYPTGLLVSAAPPPSSHAPKGGCKEVDVYCREAAYGFVAGFLRQLSRLTISIPRREDTPCYNLYCPLATPPTVWLDAR
jgi:hypothetical protein